MSDAQVAEAARLFDVLSEPSRLLILRELMGGPLTVTELVETTGMKQANVSKHLATLAAARFVQRSREGSFARYEISDPRLTSLCELMCARIRDDARDFAARLGR